MSLPKSPFVSYLEADDFWIDENKLQRQLDELEKDAGLSLIYDKAEVHDPENKNPHALKNQLKSRTEIDLKEGIQKSHGCTSSLMFRNIPRILSRLKKFSNRTYSGDWAFEILCLLEGKGLFSNSLSTAYRVHGGSETLNSLRKKNVFEGKENFLVDLLDDEELSTDQRRLIESYSFRFGQLSRLHNSRNSYSIRDWGHSLFLSFKGFFIFPVNPENPKLTAASLFMETWKSLLVNGLNLGSKTKT